jgi:hypothetical protein
MTPLSKLAKATASAVGLDNAILKTASFVAELGKHYAVDTNNAVVTPEVLPTFEVAGIRFTGLTWNSPVVVSLTFYEGYGESGYYSDGDNLYLYGEDARSLTDIVTNANDSGLVTAELIVPGTGADPIGNVEGSSGLEGGAQESTAYTDFVVALPAPTGSNAQIEFSDSSGSWGDNPLRLDADGYKVNGIDTVIKLVKTPALLITLVDVGGGQGWRIYSGASVPDNVTKPALTGAATEYSTVSCSRGVWTNAASDFAHQWQISDDGSSGWSDIEDATSTTYTILTAQIGKFLRCGVVATNASGDSEPAYSLPTEAITEMTLLTNLLAHWKFDEVSGTRFDSHGTAHLSDNNAVGSASGVLGNCADFSYGSYLSAVSSLPQLTGRAASYAFWFKTKNDMTGGYPDFCLFADFRDAGDVLHPVVGFIAAGGGRPYGSILFNFAYSGGYVGAVSVNGYADLEWHLAVITCDGTELKLYVDGAEADIMEDAGVPIDPTTITGDFPIIERHNVNGYADGWASGEIYFESMSLWNRALAPAEITKLYNGGDGLDYENF